jgi:hypothetical protein
MGIPSFEVHIPFFKMAPLPKQIPCNKVICKVTLSFTPYPLFQWYPQSKEILFNLGVKCRNLAFNAQGSRE